MAKRETYADDASTRRPIVRVLLTVTVIFTSQTACRAPRLITVAGQAAVPSPPRDVKECAASVYHQHPVLHLGVHPVRLRCRRVPPLLLVVHPPYWLHPRHISPVRYNPSGMQGISRAYDPSAGPAATAVPSRKPATARDATVHSTGGELRRLPFTVGNLHHLARCRQPASLRHCPRAGHAVHTRQQ